MCFQYSAVDSLERLTCCKCVTLCVKRYSVIQSLTVQMCVVCLCVQYISSHVVDSADVCGMSVCSVYQFTRRWLHLQLRSTAGVVLLAIPASGPAMIYTMMMMMMTMMKVHLSLWTPSIYTF